MTTRNRMTFILINIAFIAFIGLCVWDASQVNRFSGVGGKDEYRRQKYEQLERLRNNLDYLPDDMRAAEIAAIEEQIRELESDGPVREMGGEYKVKQ